MPSSFSSAIGTTPTSSANCDTGRLLPATRFDFCPSRPAKTSRNSCSRHLSSYSRRGSPKDIRGSSSRRSQPAPEKGADQSVRPKPQMLRPGSVLFLAPGDVAKGRVEPISWMQTCHAYAEHSEQVVLGTVQVRRPDAPAADRVWDHYGIEPD